MGTSATRAHRHLTNNSSPILYPIGSSRDADRNVYRLRAKKPAIGSETVAKGHASKVATLELSHR